MVEEEEEVVVVLQKKVQTHLGFSAEGVEEVERHRKHCPLKAVQMVLVPDWAAVEVLRMASARCGRAEVPQTSASIPRSRPWAFWAVGGVEVDQDLPYSKRLVVGE